MTATACHGLLARFATAEALVAAAQQVRAAGYRCIDACTPFPIEALDPILGNRGHGVKRLRSVR
jgi:hypothetical protein